MSIKNGFTIVESLLVLALVALSLGLGTFIQNSFQTKSVNQVYFWRQFRSRFDLLESASKKNRIPAMITFPTHKKVVFSLRRDNWALRVPKDLEVRQLATIRINKGGTIRPQTIDWFDKYHHQNIKQIFELGWGVYHLKKN